MFIKKLSLCLFFVFLVGCSNNSQSSKYSSSDSSLNPGSSSQYSSSETPKNKKVVMSTSITNGFDTNLTYVSSGYTFAADGRLKYWYTLMNSDTVDYSDVTAYSYMECGAKTKSDTCDMGLFRVNLKASESMTFYFYLLGSEIDGSDEIKIKIDNTYCSKNPDINTFFPRAIVKTYSVVLDYEGNSINGYNLSTVFEIVALQDYCINKTLYCHADILDTNGNLMTWTIVSGKASTEYLLDGQDVILTSEFNLLKTICDSYSRVVFTI